MLKHKTDAHPKPPQFVMWHELPGSELREWDRQWFGHELDASAVFNVRGIGVGEPLFNRNVHRPHGTGDWLIMLFHEPVRLDCKNTEPSHEGKTLVIWPPGAEQFYSWGRVPNSERHSWMHVEGTWVTQQIESLQLPVNEPTPLTDDAGMTTALTGMLHEMRLERHSDAVILQNFFEIWARCIHRDLHRNANEIPIPEGLIRVRQLLDADYRHIPPLDDLAKLACMSRSHLCHRFRELFGSSISEYVIRKRMSAAQRLLFDIQLRPGEIAEQLGYADIYQFSRQFKKTFGVSPTKYRHQHIHSNP